ncbi:hypothetical protein PRIC1_009596 [Phytophthora ramorum]
MEREKATKREAYSREVDALNRAAGEVSKQEDAVSASGAAQNGDIVLPDDEAGTEEIKGEQAVHPEPEERSRSDSPETGTSLIPTSPQELLCRKEMQRLCLRAEILMLNLKTLAVRVVSM